MFVFVESEVSVLYIFEPLVGCSQSMNIVCILVIMVSVEVDFHPL